MNDSKDCVIDILVRLRGCDDETYFHIECTEEERDSLEKVSVKSQAASTNGCMSDMWISKTLFPIQPSYEGIRVNNLNRGDLYFQRLD